MYKAVCGLVDKAKDYGVELRQSYIRVSKKALLKNCRYRHAKQMKRAKKEEKFLRVRLKRLIRDIRRKTEDIKIPDFLEEALSKAIYEDRSKHIDKASKAKLSNLKTLIYRHIVALYGKEIEKLKEDIGVTPQTSLTSASIGHMFANLDIASVASRLMKERASRSKLPWRLKSFDFEEKEIASLLSNREKIRELFRSNANGIESSI